MSRKKGHISTSGNGKIPSGGHVVIGGKKTSWGGGREGKGSRVKQDPKRCYIFEKGNKKLLLRIKGYAKNKRAHSPERRKTSIKPRRKTSEHNEGPESCFLQKGEGDQGESL